MKCSKCGAPLSPENKFCFKCGAPVEKENMNSDAKGKTGVIWIAVIIAVIVIGVIAAVILFMKKDGGDPAKDTDPSDRQSAEASDAGGEKTGGPASDSAGEGEVSGEGETSDKDNPSHAAEDPGYLSGLVQYETAQYHYLGLELLDLSLRNYTPNPKQEGMEWDSSLFYALEDVYEGTADDDQIARYTLSVHSFLNAQSGNRIQCFVYTHPGSGQINKIVTVEQIDGQYVISDYYYSNDKVNFVFTRTADVYTPTYATIDKVGNRYYFQDDVMVRYRVIRSPRQIVQQTLTSSETWYPNASYFALGGEEQAAYDAVEYQVLNEAYNVYNAVRDSGNIYTLEGYVYSAEGAPLANVSVAVIDSGSSSVLYSGTTAEDGSYHIYLSLDQTDCYLQIYQEGYLPVYIYDMKLDSGILANTASCIYLSGVESAEKSVKLYLYDSVALTGNADAAALQNAQVIVRRGLNARNGERIAEGGTGEAGVFETVLAPGAYTAEYSLGGYAATYENFYVTAEACIVKGYTVPAITDASEKIVLCWDSDIDLDLVLYTPEKSNYGDMNYVSIAQPYDGYGNFLIADGTASRCEVLNLSNRLEGVYRIFVNDYTNYKNGVYDANALAMSGARIYVYTSEGLAAVYRIAFGKSGVVWNVCEKGTSYYYPCSIVSSHLEHYLLINKELTADTVLEMYREFLRGNITADYQGTQITYDSLLWDVFGGGCSIEDANGLRESFALTDMNMDNVPELQINYWDMGLLDGNAVYTVKLIDGHLQISNIASEGYMDSITVYQDGSYYVSHGLSMDWAVKVYDAQNDPLAYFVYLSSEYYGSDLEDEVRQKYEDGHREGYPYIYITSDDVRTSEAFEAYMTSFISMYCGGEVTFYPVDEASIRDYLKWER